MVFLGTRAIALGPNHRGNRHPSCCRFFYQGG